MSVSFRRIIVPETHRKVFTGQSVNVLAETVDTGIISRLVNTEFPPIYSLFDPNGVQVLHDVDMDPVQKGVYNRVYNVPFDSPEGLYTGNFSVEHSGAAARLERIVLFKVILGSDPSFYTYQVMVDQEGNIWYWWITVADTIMSSHNPPDFPLTKVPIALPGAYYWIEALNPDDDTLRYIYPSLTGVPTVDSTQPPIGTGAIQSPSFINTGQETRILTLSIIDEILVTEP